MVIWGVALWYFSYLSNTHSWILPLFAVGLLAPRWAQICTLERIAMFETYADCCNRVGHLAIRYIHAMGWWTGGIGGLESLLVSI